MDNLADKLFELTYSGATQKQRSITSLFPQFVSRVKAVAAKGGVHLQDIKKDTWHFKVHSGTKDDVWYDNYIKFIDLPELLSRLAADRRLWTKDKQHINLTKLAREVMTKADIQWLCNCPSDIFHGFHFIRTQRNAKIPPPENRPPVKRNPRQLGAFCKHLQAIFNVFPWYVSNAAKWLRDYYGKQLQYIEKQAKKEQQQFKTAAGALRKRKVKSTKESIVNEEMEDDPRIKTARSFGAVGQNAIVPKVVPKYANKGDTILDFGSGPLQKHANILRSNGLNVDTVDLSLEDKHIGKKYNLMYASNVLNVQRTDEQLNDTLSQISDYLTPDGKVILNYPKTPRKLQFTTNEMAEKLKAMFSNVQRLSTSDVGSNIVWICSGKINMKKVKEDLATLSDPKLKKLFAQDKIEDLQRKIHDLEQLAKATPKGFLQSNIYAKIDAHEKELSQLKRSMGEKVEV